MGAAYPTRQIVEKIALYFEVPVSELIGKDETALVALEGKTLGDKINFWVSIIIIIIVVNLAFAIFIFLPVFPLLDMFIRFPKDKVPRIENTSITAFLMERKRSRTQSV